MSEQMDIDHAPTGPTTEMSDNLLYGGRMCNKNVPKYRRVRRLECCSVRSIRYPARMAFLRTRDPREVAEELRCASAGFRHACLHVEQVRREATCPIVGVTIEIKRAIKTSCTSQVAAPSRATIEVHAATDSALSSTQRRALVF